jgi:hypothetical protein
MDYSHIANNGDDFDNGEEELCFSITFDTEQVYGYDYHQENRDEDGMIVFCVIPEIDGDGGCDDLQGKNSEPLHSIVLSISALSSTN